MRRFLWTFAILAVCVTSFWAADRPKKDTPAAAATRKKLKKKISVDFQDTTLKDVVKEIQKQLDNKISIKLDAAGGVSNNLTITYSAEDKPLDKILDEMFAKNQLGYVVISNANERRDGFLIIKKGKQRGYDTGEEPEKAAKDKNAKKDKDKEDDGDEKPKDKPVKKDKAAKKDKTAKKDKDKEDDDGDEKPKDKPAKKDKAAKKDKVVKKDKAAKDKSAEDGDEDKAEQRASSKLNLAKMLEKDGKIEKAKLRYKGIIEDFPKTKAADEARKLLKKLEE